MADVEDIRLPNGTVVYVDDRKLPMVSKVDSALQERCDAVLQVLTDFNKEVVSLSLVSDLWTLDVMVDGGVRVQLLKGSVSDLLEQEDEVLRDLRSLLSALHEVKVIHT